MRTNYYTIAKSRGRPRKQKSDQHYITGEKVLAAEHLEKIRKNSSPLLRWLENNGEIDNDIYSHLRWYKTQLRRLVNQSGAPSMSKSDYSSIASKWQPFTSGGDAEDCNDTEFERFKEVRHVMLQQMKLVVHAMESILLARGFSGEEFQCLDKQRKSMLINAIIDFGYKVSILNKK